MPFMSNDARKISRSLEMSFGSHNPDIDEIIAMEQSILQYYPKSIISVMCDMIGKAKEEKKANYANFSYSLPGLRRITTKRSSNPRKLIGWETFKQVYSALSKLIIVDYNTDVLMQMISIADAVDNRSATMHDIGIAVNTSVQCNNYSVQYAGAILNRRIAEKALASEKAKAIDNMTVSADVKEAKQQISFIERMSIEALWNERKENSDLEERLRRAMK